jgi:hypothetical protein
MRKRADQRRCREHDRDHGHLDPASALLTKADDLDRQMTSIELKWPAKVEALGSYSHSAQAADLHLFRKGAASRRPKRQPATK